MPESAPVEPDGGRERQGVAPPLPRSIWVVAWASLAGQTVLLVSYGGRVGDEASTVISAGLGALLVGYVSAGVIRARTIRVVLAWVVLILSVLGGLLSVVSVDRLPRAVLAALSLATTAVALAGLARFQRSDWYRWQRSRPPAREGASIRALVAIGVLVGVLGGLVGSVDDGVDLRVSVADH
ncbi:hypothetical protein FXB39_05240 [Nocardioides sp. BGMRC 2183]|nr:hypothetical protein FXB39_05240 [Nocardioides sp. BGMRC 2183]